MPNTATIPNYPESVGLTVESLRTAGELLESLEPYSDFDLASLWAWDDGSTLLARLGAGLLVRFPGYEPEDPQEWGVSGVVSAEEVVDLLAGTNEITRLVHVPEPLAERLRNDARLAVAEELDHHDYVLYLPDYVTAVGSPYRSLRKQRAESARVDLRIVQPSVGDIGSVLDEVDAQWIEARPERVPAGLREQIARRRLTDDATKFDLIAHLALDPGGEPVGYLLSAAASQTGWATAHFGKAAPQANASLCLREAQELLARDIKWLNIEQDLGVPGLRSWKTSQRPARMLRKFSVAPAVT